MTQKVEVHFISGAVERFSVVKMWYNDWFLFVEAEYGDCTVVYPFDLNNIVRIIKSKPEMEN